MSDDETGDLRVHDATKFSPNPTGMGNQGICSMKLTVVERRLSGAHEQPVVDYFEKRRNRNGTVGRWLALCRYHANRRGITDEAIARACSKATAHG